MNKNSNIGFVGLGNMGKPIFDNLNKEFSNVFCFDKDTSKLKKNKFSSSLNEIFEKCKIIIFCIESNEQIIDIIKENAIKKNTIIIDLTSSLPELTKQISSYLKIFESHYIDAGMSGGASGASNGTLTLMLGGSKTICKKIDFILKTFAKNIFYLGKSGNGHLMKLLHNSVCHSIFLINCEILNIAKSYGITDTDVIDVFNKSNARSYISENRFPNNILNGKFNGKSTIKNLKKDLKMMSSILKNSKSKKKYTELSNEILSKIDDKLNMEDFTNIYKMWDKI
jgi:3-hydroxyisobutyrate dehydrogenase